MFDKKRVFFISGSQVLQDKKSHISGGHRPGCFMRWPCSGQCMECHHKKPGNINNEKKRVNILDSPVDALTMQETID
jgi:hypothetical protein